jgi:cyanophycin synthetase
MADASCSARARPASSMPQPQKTGAFPAIRLLPTGNLVQLGYGAAQRRIWTAETDRTSAIAEGISRDKDLTKTLLRRAACRSPKARWSTAPEDAWEAAEDIGLPVVVKPSDGNHGRGVFTNLMTPRGSRGGLTGRRRGRQRRHRRTLHPGSEHRLLVVGGKLVAAARGERRVVGDGKSTINELIELQINSDPRRGEHEEFPLDVVAQRNPVGRASRWRARASRPIRSRRWAAKC